MTDAKEPPPPPFSRPDSYELHAAWIGQGFGYDRLLDYHLKMNDVVAPTSTTGNASLDAWAIAHEAHGVAYHPFNLSQVMMMPTHAMPRHVAQNDITMHGVAYHPF